MYYFVGNIFVLEGFSQNKALLWLCMAYQNIKLLYIYFRIIHALLCTVSPLQALAMKFIHTHTKLWGVNSAKIYKYYIDNILCHHRYYDAIG